MKLYYMPGACSLAPHIALREAGLSFTLVKVDYKTRRTEDGRDFRYINAKGYVPGLLLKDGWLLTEVPVILQFIDDLVPQAAAPRNAGVRRGYRYLEWLNYIATEIHKSFSPLFRPTTPKTFLKVGRDHLSRRLAVVENHLQDNKYLLGSLFSSADAYLFTVCRWLDDQNLTPSHWPSLLRHSRDVGVRPSVRGALHSEGLLQETTKSPSSCELSSSMTPRRTGRTSTRMPG